MIILISLFLVSIMIFWIQYNIWKVERNIVFPIFTTIFYFWSLAGSWLFSFDQLTHFGKSIGLQYYYLLEKMFHVHFDKVYLQAIWMYGIFIIIFQLFIFAGIKRIKKIPTKESIHHPINLRPTAFALIALLFLIISLWIVKDVIIYSLLLNESVYLNIRSAVINNYTIHQYACWIMIVSLYVYVGLFLKQNEANLIVTKPGVFFWTIFCICNLYLVIIGSRHEVFFGGIVVLILMSYPFRSIRTSKKLYFSVFAIWLIILMLNDPIRSLMPVISKKTGLTSLFSSKEKLIEANYFENDRTFIAHKSPKLSVKIIEANALTDTTLYLKQDTVIMNKNSFMNQLKNHPNYLIVDHKKLKFNDGHTSIVYQNNSFLTKLFLTVTNLIFSNEMFAGHFSMYGVLSKHVKPKIGFSFKNLLYSFIPSTIVQKRPLDSYTFYAQEMGFKPGQGFTVNYITAWYLNFSYFGLILGPLFLSFILLLPFYLATKLKRNLFHLFAIIAMCGITGFAAMMVRTGPESLKALMYESILIPMFIVYAAISFDKARNFFSKKYGK
ncbi:MAG: hypothetical protein RIS20_1802 [Bacteroidota bacterium]